jgi:serine/threonine protein phosphatase PrpC
MEADAPRRVVLAVADGHGSARCFRSDSGARLAVAAATQTLDRLAGSGLDIAEPGIVRKVVEALHRRWIRGVARALAAAPLTEVELEALARKEGMGARRQVERNPRLAFGSTVLAALVTETYVLYVQLGDGDILVVGADGGVSRPLAADPRLFGNATTSLCSYDAVRSFRTGVQPLDLDSGRGAGPALILLSTDGYANSFRDDAGFMQVGTDLLEIIREEGVAAVDASLESWLDEASRCGSGDDVTVGLLYRAPGRTSPHHRTQGVPGGSPALPETEKGIAHAGSGSGRSASGASGASAAGVAETAAG